MPDLENDGARHGRSFSFSAALRSDGLLRLTNRQQVDGRESGAVHALSSGQMVQISRAQGRFAAKSEMQP